MIVLLLITSLLLLIIKLSEENHSRNNINDSHVKLMKLSLLRLLKKALTGLLWALVFLIALFTVIAWRNDSE